VRYNLHNRLRGLPLRNMSTRFLHTADWQLGKPFAGIEEDDKRVLVQQERINVLNRIGQAARDQKAEFILAAGDLFDSPTPKRASVSAVCSAVGAMPVPVYAISGNHDHAGPGSLWEQEFFVHEWQQLAPNLHLLLKPEPVDLGQAVIFPCPLLRPHESTDPTAWLRSPKLDLARYGDKPRVVLAHGSVQGFASPEADDEDAGGGLPNQIDLDRLPEETFDYIALGDWHGAKEVGPKAWSPGTPELDRFPKGGDHAPGKVLVVTARRGGLPDVQPLATARFGWHEVDFQFADDSALAQLEERVVALIGGRASQDLLRLRLSGVLGIEATTRLERTLDAWKARLLRIELSNGTILAPSQSEMEALQNRPDDPLISRVSVKLLAVAHGGDEEAAIARIALRELYASCRIH
jgi:DNA repair exonuclease SbcCD nuclease subunit